MLHGTRSSLSLLTGSIRRAAVLVEAEEDPAPATMAALSRTAGKRALQAAWHRRVGNLVIGLWILFHTGLKKFIS
jgi:hypothetical protein